MTKRDSRCELVRVARALPVLMILMVLFVATQPPAFGATRLNRHVSTIGQHTTDGRSCLKTKALKTGRTSLRFPSCWTLGNYKESSTFFYVLAYWSNQPMHNPCTTKRSGTATSTICGFPVKTLGRGGVLVMLIEGGVPGWKLADQRGQRLVVDHHVARESVTRNPYGPLHATEEIDILIDAGVADNFYVLDVFFRDPGVAEDQLLLQKMIRSMRIK